MKSTKFTQEKALNIRRKYYYWKRKLYKCKEILFSDQSFINETKKKVIKSLTAFYKVPLFWWKMWKTMKLTKKDTFILYKNSIEVEKQT